MLPNVFACNENIFFKWIAPMSICASLLWCLGSLLLQNVFPWMFDEIHALRKFKDAAQLLAKKKDWPPLYDIAMLKNNKVFIWPFYSWLIISSDFFIQIFSFSIKISTL